MASDNWERELGSGGEQAAAVTVVRVILTGKGRAE